ncbi:MAG TPA: class II aldolase/adducin family protein [Burkholderiales bacterium]
MRNRWNDTEAAACASALARRVYSSRLIGSEPALVLYGGGNTSLKAGEGADRVLHVKGSGADLGQVTEADFTPLALAPLLELLRHDALPAATLAEAVAPFVLRAGASKPSIETLMHAALPWPYVEHTHATAVLAVCNTEEAQANVRAAFGGSVVMVPYRHSGFDLARACAAAYAEQDGQNARGMVLMHHGACAWGADARASYEAMLGLANRAEAFLRERGAWELPEAQAPAATIDAPRARVIARLRRDAAQAAGRPLIVTPRDDAVIRAFAARGDLGDITRHGPATPGHAIFTKCFPQLGRDVAAFSAAYAAHLGGTPLIDRAPRVVLDAELGLLGLGVNKFAADAAADIYRSDARVIARAQALGGYATIAPDLMLKAEIEYAGFETRVAQREPQAGRVLLAADALAQRAQIAEWLAAGGAVVALAADPAVTALAQGASYLGLHARADDADDRARALAAATRAFGGIDSVLHPSSWDDVFSPLLEFSLQ